MRTRPSTPLQRTASLALAVALTLTLAACGGGSDSSTPDAGTAATTPTILAQPLDSQILAGGEARFSITTSGQGVTYQWQRSTDGGQTWQDIQGANSSMLVLPSVTSTDNGHLIRTLVTLGGTSTPSTAARLTVAAAVVAPSISVAPANVTTVAGTDASFTVTAEGTSLAYQWQRSSDGNQWTDIAGQTTPTLTLSAVGIDSDGIQLRVTVNNSAGSVASAAAQLRVQPVSATPSISSQPVAASVVAPAAATFAVTASGQPTPSYQWQRSTDGGSTYVDIAGATSASFTTGPTSLANHGERFRVQVSNSAGSVISQAQLLTVTAAQVAPAISQQPQDQSVAAGQTVTLTSAADGTPSPTLQWQVSLDGGTTWTNINGATSSSYAFTTSAGDHGRRYRVVATNSRGSASSRGALLTVTSPASSLDGRRWAAGSRWIKVNPTSSSIDQAVNSRLLMPSLLRSAIDQKGRVTTLYVQQVDARAGLLAVRTTPGSGGSVTTSAPVVIDAGAPADVMSGITLAVSPNGNVVAGWNVTAPCNAATYATNGACGYLYTARYLTSTGRWEAPTLVGDTPTPGITLAINDTGDVAAIYYSVKPTVDENVHSVVAWRGASQSTFRSLSYSFDPVNGTFLPQALHLDGSGRFTFAGRLQNVSNVDIATLRGSVIDGAGAVEVVDQRGANAAFDGLFGNSSGQQVLMWHQDNGTRISQYAATLDSATGNWLVSDLGTPAQAADVVPGALAEDGSFQWYSFSTLRCSTQRRVNGVWGTETALPAALCTGSPQITIASNGNLLAVRTLSTMAGQWLSFDASLQKLVHSPSATPLPGDYLFGMQGTLEGRLLLASNGIGAFVSINQYEVFPTPEAPNGDTRGLNSIWGHLLQ